MNNHLFEVNDLIKDLGFKPLDLDSFGFGNLSGQNATPQNPISKPITFPQAQQKNYEVKASYTPLANGSNPYYQVGNTNIGNIGKDYKPRAESSHKYQPVSHNNYKVNDDLAAKYKYTPNNPLKDLNNPLSDLNNPLGGIGNPNKVSILGNNLQPPTKLSNIGTGTRSSNVLPAYNPAKESQLNLKSPSNSNNPKDSYLQFGGYSKPQTGASMVGNTPPYIPLAQQQQHSANPDINKIIADIKRNSGSSTSPNTPIQGYTPNSASSPYNPINTNNKYNIGGYTSNTPTPQPSSKDISPYSNFNQYGINKEPISKPADNTPYNNSSPYSNPSNIQANPNKQSNFSNANNYYPKVEQNNMSTGLSKSTISPFSSTQIKSNRPKYDSKYKAAYNICSKNNTEFTDYEFPANQKSIADAQNISEYRSIKQWVRPKVIWGNNEFELYYRIIEPNDIQQGYLGDCAFLSTIAAIAETPQRIQKIFINEKKSQYGLYGLNLVWKGAPVEVIIDDLIPVDANNKPYFQQSKEKELWAFLLEKAWAKLHKNYHQLNGQLVKESMHDITGAPVRNFDPRNHDQNSLWRKILKSKQAGLNRIVCAGTLGEDTGDDNDPLKKHGLVSGHAYSLIGAYEITLTNGRQEKLVKMRNPWGNFEWNKTFADKDYQWQFVKEQDKLLMEYKNEDDGTFFMKFDTFRTFYDSVDICYYFDDLSYFGMKCRSSCNQSKFFKVDLKKDSYCFFFVSQLSIRCFDEDYQFVSPKDQGHYSETKLCVADANGKIIHKIKGKKRDLFSPKYVDDEDRQKFSAGTYYVFVQVQWQKNATHSFGIGCYTRDAEIKEILQYEAKPLSPFVDKWISQELYDNDIEKVYGRV